MKVARASRALLEQFFGSPRADVGVRHRNPRAQRMSVPDRADDRGVPDMAGTDALVRDAWGHAARGPCCEGPCCGGI